MIGRAQDEGGFSLVEVLVSVFIFAVIGTVSVALMAASLDAQEVNRTALDRTARLDRARTLLRDDVGQIVLRPARDAQGYREPQLFAGSDSGLVRADGDDTERVLLELMRRGRPNPGLLRPRSSLIRVEYLVRGDRLVRRAYDYPDPDLETRVVETILAEGVEDVRIEFLVGAVWVRRAMISARGQGALPVAVRVRYDLAPYGLIEHLVLTPEARA